MNITKKGFGTYNNQQVDQYTLTNDNDVSISVLTFAGLWREFNVPSKGKTQNILLNASSVANYNNNPFYVGRVIGRIAGRLKNGQFNLNGTDYQVDQNEGNNMLHGGKNGFANQVWAATTDQTSNTVSITLTKTMTEAMDQFPGTMPASVTYTLSNDNSVKLAFTASSDEDTLFNPTSHAYWNLADENTDNILNHTLQINSDNHLDVDNEKMPTGKMLANQGTPFDFSQPVVLKKAIHEMSNTTEKGFDDIVEVKGSEDTPIATLTDQASGRKIKIFSNRNGLIVFTANSMNSDATFNRGIGHPYEAIALEAQTLPDTPHHPEFGDITLKANETKSYEIKYEVEF
ncbi:aldose epimerase family protein [Paucilactobacillus kaifaensis]|uniref:aldose epimerase family protein n=1 Tax=Paucilactobacillus kaifaensis TaxID=2559921 RepID=UPI0010F9DA79|nr:aldose epimerase family protein [Paucilactobacillus kaifaensis]